MKEMLEVQKCLIAIAVLVREFSLEFGSDRWLIEAVMPNDKVIYEEHESVWYVVNKALFEIRKTIVVPHPVVPKKLVWREYSSQLTSKYCSCGALVIELCGYIETERPYSHNYYKCEAGHIWHTSQVMD